MKCICCDPTLFEYIENRNQIETIIIPKGVYELQKEWFVGFDNLQVLQLGDQVKKIEENSSPIQNS